MAKNKVLYFEGKQGIQVGDQTVTFSSEKMKKGDKVDLHSRMGDHLGVRPLARGEVVSACKDERGAPVTPTRAGKRKANAWRWLYRIVVREIIN